jgi:hypothetical protein
MTRASFQRQGGMQLNASKAGDDDPPVRFAKQGLDLLGAESASRQHGLQRRSDY